MRQRKNHFWNSETFWEYVVLVVSCLASIGTTLLLIKLGWLRL